MTKPSAKTKSRPGRELGDIMPILLDTSGILLLSGSAMIVNVAAGLAAAGVGCLVLNWRIYGK